MIRLNLTYPVYPELTIQQGGHLPDDKRAFACWYYYTLAQQLYEKLGDSTEDQFGLLEGEPWLNPQYEQIARSVAIRYGFPDPGPFMEDRFWEVVRQQAIQLQLPIPKERYMKPLRIQLVGNT